ncbi:hypothetical protein C1646_535174 [Rhizophagus diaphanus]|nr:hypothetical protein C1646_535174 [Rhizophagus diaphanus] [Rhizophagus sp. MUCL 43196]
MNVMEGILTSNNPGYNERQNVKAYLKVFMEKMTWKQLDVAIKAEKKKLRVSEKWKHKSLKLAKIFKDQFENDRNMLTKEQTEYNYIINFISRLFKLMFKEDDEVELDWGEKTLKAAAILKNQSLRDDYRRSHGNKIDLLLSINEILLEMSIMEVSGAPCETDHSHYVGDRNKIAKMLKIIINNIAINYPGDFGMLRKIKFFGIQIYAHTFYVYSMSMPFPATYYYKLEYKFTCPKTMRTLHKELPKFGYNLWKVRDLVKSSVSDIMSYIDNEDSEASDITIDPVKQSPRKTRARKS